MYAYIKGSLEVKTKGYVVIDVSGIGYKIFMSETAIEKLGEIGQVVKIHIITFALIIALVVIISKQK